MANPTVELAECSGESQKAGMSWSNLGTDQMALVINLHPQNPQRRLVQQCVEILNSSGVAAIPTDCCYVLAAKLGDKSSMEKMANIRQIGIEHNFTLMCRGFSDISTYSKLSDRHFRLLKSIFPGAFTVVLQGTKEVPKRLLNPKRSTIGLRIPDFRIIQELIKGLNEPLLSCSLIIDGQDLNDPLEIQERAGKLLDLIIEAENYSCYGRTTIVDLHDGEINLIRQGKGNAKLLGIS